MPLSPEALNKLAELRQKSILGTITEEELKGAIKLMREDRSSAALRTDAAKRVKARKAIPSADELLDQLEGLG